MTLDVQLFYLLNGLAGQSAFIDALVVFCASYLPYIVPGFFFVLLLLSQYQKREKLEILLVSLLSGLAARFVATELIRFFYHRPRPFADLPVHQLITNTGWSFPSGHATFFFAFATVIYLYHKKWGIFFFVVTVLMTVSRVIAGIHYPSDIVGGAFIGIVVGYAAFYLARTVAKNGDKTT